MYIISPDVCGMVDGNTPAAAAAEEAVLDAEAVAMADAVFVVAANPAAVIRSIRRLRISVNPSRFL